MKSFILSIVLSATVGMGCTNFFKDAAKKDFDAAYIYEARKKMDKLDWDNALVELAKVSTVGQADRSYKALLASVYAGRCGLNLIELTNTVQGGAAAFFPMLLNAFKGSTVTNHNDCLTAESTLLSISTSSTQRTGDENILLALIEWAKIGTLLASDADIDPDLDGTINPTLSACATTELSNTQIDALGFGLTISLNSLAQTAISTGTGSIDALCNNIATYPAEVASFCTKVDPGTQSFTADERKFIAWLLRSGDAGLGFGQCNLGAATLCSTGCTIP